MQRKLFVCFTEGKQKNLQVPIKLWEENLIFLALYNLSTQSIKKPFHAEFISYTQIKSFQIAHIYLSSL